MIEHVSQPNSYLTAQAIYVGLGSSMLSRCPIHRDVLISLAEGDDLPMQPDNDLQATIRAIADATPHFCPVCVNADPE